MPKGETVVTLVALCNMRNMSKQATVVYIAGAKSMRLSQAWREVSKVNIMKHRQNKR